MNRRKGVPCGCDAEPCGCSPKNHCVKAINNVSPDPNGDLTIKAGAGISISQTGDDEITIVNAATPSAYVEGTNIEFTPSGDDISINVVDDPVIDGTLTVNGDIVQNGAAYETHAEKVFTKDDYIVMRDGAVGALAAGDYSGFQVEKYDGTNDGRLVIDRDGVARVGDVNDEQPLLTRDETADLTDGHLLEWDANASKAVDAGTDVSAINTAINGKVSGTGNIGSDTKPIKIVNGQAVEVMKPLADFTPLVAHVETTTLGDVIQCIGRLTYQRVGYKKGLLSGTVKITSNSASGFVVTNLTKIGNYFGLQFVIPSSNVRTGQWISSNDRIDFSGYGSYVIIDSNGNIQFGRVYNASGEYGSWSLSDMSDICIMFQNVEITEA